MAHDAIVLANADDQVVFWNQAAEKMFGYSSAEISHKKLHDVLAPHVDRIEKEKKFSALKQTGKSPMAGKTLELIARRKDGRHLPVELSISNVTIKHEVYVIGTIRDMTGRKTKDKTSLTKGVKTKSPSLTSKARKQKKKA
jgi:PAS domain S-box-containing protein